VAPNFLNVLLLVDEFPFPSLALPAPSKFFPVPPPQGSRFRRTWLPKFLVCALSGFFNNCGPFLGNNPFEGLLDGNCFVGRTLSHASESSSSPSALFRTLVALFFCPRSPIDGRGDLSQPARSSCRLFKPISRLQTVPCADWALLRLFALEPHDRRPLSFSSSFSKRHPFLLSFRHSEEPPWGSPSRRIPLFSRLLRRSSRFQKLRCRLGIFSKTESISPSLWVLTSPLLSLLTSFFPNPYVLCVFAFENGPSSSLASSASSSLPIRLVLFAPLPFIAPFFLRLAAAMNSRRRRAFSVRAVVVPHPPLSSMVSPLQRTPLRFWAPFLHWSESPNIFPRDHSPVLVL